MQRPCYRQSLQISKTYYVCKLMYQLLCFSTHLQSQGMNINGVKRTRDWEGPNAILMKGIIQVAIMGNRLQLNITHLHNTKFSIPLRNVKIFYRNLLNTHILGTILQLHLRDFQFLHFLVSFF